MWRSNPAVELCQHVNPRWDATLTFTPSSSVRWQRQRCPLSQRACLLALQAVQAFYSETSIVLFSLGALKECGHCDVSAHYWERRTGGMHQRARKKHFVRGVQICYQLRNKHQNVDSESYTSHLLLFIDLFAVKQRGALVDPPLPPCLNLVDFKLVILFSTVLTTINHYYAESSLDWRPQV